MKSFTSHDLWSDPAERCINPHRPGRLCSQDFADELDVMPSITMENNVIHNNEGYGVILVKPNNREQHRSEGRQSSTRQTITLSYLSLTLLCKHLVVL